MTASPNSQFLFPSNANAKYQFNNDLSDNSIFSPDISTNSSSIKGYDSTFTPASTSSTTSSNYRHNMSMGISEDDDNDADADAADNDNKSDYNSYNMRNTMHQHGYSPVCLLNKTLQGCIYRAKYLKNGMQVVIKITNKQLMSSSMSFNAKTGKHTKCHENIQKEINIMHYLNTGITHSGMIQLITFFEDSYNLFVVMEDGGRCLLDFVNEVHSLIRSGGILLTDWQETTHLIAKQIIDFMIWLHNTKGVCHLDISLENMVINNIEWIINKKSGIKVLKPTFIVKFCDYGLAEIFINNGFISFNSSKFCGKRGYQAPKIYKKQTYNASLADVWSLGVCLFMIAVGSPPFMRPDTLTDNNYKWIVTRNHFYSVLCLWNRQHYINYNLFDLIHRIWVHQQDRIPIKYILKHPYMRDGNKVDNIECEWDNMNNNMNNQISIKSNNDPTQWNFSSAFNNNNNNQIAMKANKDPPQWNFDFNMDNNAWKF